MAPLDPASLAGAALLLGAGVAAIALGGKAHGRQVRLERELQGHAEVAFGGPNDPAVEALWARDKVVFLAALGGALAALLAYAVLAWLLPLPFPGRAGGAEGFLLGLLGLAAWAMLAAFTAAGARSLARLRAALRAGARGPAEGWADAARRGSALWWGLVALAWALFAVLLL